MCFSAPASFAAAAALGSAGAVGLRKARTASRRPIAAVPLLFGLQQALEGALWLSFGHARPQAAATVGFLLFSHVLWPAFLPYAVWKDEPNPKRRRLLAWFAWFGAAVGVYLLHAILRGPVSAMAGAHGITYDVPLPNLAVVPAAYVIATCGSCLASTQRLVRLFGLALLVSLGIAYWAHQQAFASVWCFFAAILSGILLLHLHRRPLA